MGRTFASDQTRPAARTALNRARAGTRSTPAQGLAQLQVQADASPATTRLSQLVAQQPATQRIEEEELLQGRTIQRAEDEEMLQGRLAQRMEDEEEPMQGKADGNAPQAEARTAPGGGGSGLPDGLRQGVEKLSGADMIDVNVHYNSTAPAQVGAHAYAQGRDIHLASGQERHLPHEAWHIVQQQQGRVQATTIIAGTPVNDAPDLEREADTMGAKASQMVSVERQS